MLSDVSEQVRAILPSAGVAGVTEILGATIDMAAAGAQGVRMTVAFGAITAGAVTTIKAQQGALADMSDAADLAGTEQAIVDTGDDSFRYIDISLPTKRYLRLVVVRGTQNAVVSAAFYTLYGLRNRPGLSPDVLGENHQSPIEGTA